MIEKIYCFYLNPVLLSAKRGTRGNEKGKHNAYDIDHRFWPKSL